MKTLRELLDEGLKPDTKTPPIERLTPFYKALVEYLDELRMGISVAPLEGTGASFASVEDATPSTFRQEIPPSELEDDFPTLDEIEQEETVSNEAATEVAPSSPKSEHGDVKKHAAHKHAGEKHRTR